MFNIRNAKSAECIFTICFLVFTFSGYSDDLNIKEIKECTRKAIHSILDIKPERIIIGDTVRVFPIGLPYRTARADDLCRLDISTDNCTIFYFSKISDAVDRADLLIPVDKGKTAETAFEAAEAILALLELQLDYSDFNPSLLNLNGRNVDKDLQGAFWRFNSELRYKEIPCRDRFISLTVNAVTGKIRSFGYRPIILPEENLSDELLQKLDKEILLEKAQEWLDQEPYFKQNSAKLISSDRDKKLVIAPECNYYRLDRSFREKQDSYPLKTHYCWEEEFSWKEYGIKEPGKGNIWLDVRNGNVIGAH